MFVHLFLGLEDAERIYDRFVHTTPNNAQAPAQFCDWYQKRPQEPFMSALDATLCFTSGHNRCALKFRDYISEVPALLQEMNVTVAGAELVRHSSAPTRARAGRYERRDIGLTARVERVFPTQQTSNKTVPLYVQNIRVIGPSLGAVLKFNSQVSQGRAGRFLVEPWE